MAGVEQKGGCWSDKRVGPNSCWSTWIGLLWGGLINAIIALAVWDKDDPDKMEGVMKSNNNWAGLCVSGYAFVYFLGTTLLFTTPPEGQGCWSRKDVGLHEWVWGLLLASMINVIVSMAIYDAGDGDTVKNAHSNTATAGILASVWVFSWWTSHFWGPRKDNPPDPKGIRWFFGLWLGALINFILAHAFYPSDIASGSYWDDLESAVRSNSIGWLLLGVYFQVHWIMYGVDLCRKVCAGGNECNNEGAPPSGDEQL